MKRLSILFFLTSITQPLWAQNEIGPEGHKLLWLLLVLVAAIVALFFFVKLPAFSQKKGGPFIKRKKVSIDLVKDRLYYPDELMLIVTNEGNSAVDIDLPLLVLSSIWLKRKFRLKGTNNASFYPLYLDKEQSHTLSIDLNRFYSHSRSLKKLQKAKVVIFEVNGRRLGSQSVYLRKTLFKF